MNIWDGNKPAHRLDHKTIIARSIEERSTLASLGRPVVSLGEGSNEGSLPLWKEKPTKETEALRVVHLENKTYS